MNHNIYKKIILILISENYIIRNESFDLIHLIGKMI